MIQNEKSANVFVTWIDDMVSRQLKSKLFYLLIGSYLQNKKF